jgi:hypothetical protein
MSATRPRTLGEVLTHRRRARFVGREGEVELFLEVLERARETPQVLYVSGPGGVGKTALLDACRGEALARGLSVVSLDGRELAPTPAAVLESMAESLGVASGGSPIDVPEGRSLVVLVDGYEHLAPLDGWFREHLLPRLPATTLTVLADRAPPTPQWRADPAWSETLRVISLRNLSADAAYAYLQLRGVDADRFAEVAALTYGHPLALSLVCDVIVRAPDIVLPSLPDDVVRGLLDRMVSTVPSAAHRRTLEIAALARVTNEDVLRHTLSDASQAHELFEWLARLSFVEPTPDGVSPHDLVRDLLDSELRWRDRAGYREVFRALQEYLLRQIRDTSGREQQRGIVDLKFCFRSLRSVMSPVPWGDWGDHYPDPARADDREAILDLVRSAEGAQSGVLAEHWLDRQPEGFHVIRGPGERVRGVVAVLDLTAAGPAMRAVDPGAAAAWRFVEQTVPPRPGDTVTQCRFVVDKMAYQEPSPTLNAVPILTLQRQLTIPHLAYDFVTLAEPDRWEEYFLAADLPRARGADFDVDGRRYGLFAHDFRAVPVEAMVRRWTERALADDALLTPVDPERELLVLAYPDFDAAVRQGLRDLHRPDLLARNPLLRTALTRRYADENSGSGADVLVSTLWAAAASLTEDPRDDRLFRAVDQTYLRASRTQEAAAAALGLPFSTYRRHLRQGVDRLVAWLWNREVGATPE